MSNADISSLGPPRSVARIRISNSSVSITAISDYTIDSAQSLPEVELEPGSRCRPPWRPRPARSTASPAGAPYDGSGVSVSFIGRANVSGVSVYARLNRRTECSPMIRTSMSCSGRRSCGFMTQRKPDQVASCRPFHSVTSASPILSRVPWGSSKLKRATARKPVCNLSRTMELPAAPCHESAYEPWNHSGADLLDREG